jgi:peptidoglycan/xylan/chitin deacetylase (PgdA/CDA1 family)
MNRIRRLWCAIALCAGLGGAHAVHADDRAALQAACWQPSALAAVEGERAALRLRRPAVLRVPSAEPGASAIVAAVPVKGAIRRVVLPPGSRLIALTFDLCETAGEVAGYDGAVIDYLRAEKVKVTFFAGGKWMLSHKTRAQQLLSDPLFEIGTHGWAHRNTRLISGAELAREIGAPSSAYAAVRSELGATQCAARHVEAVTSIPERPALYRFPFGACNAESLQAVADAGLLAIQWDVATGDPSPLQSARAIADAMIRNARPGSIIISHANGRGYHTAEALPMAIPALKAKGFRFVTISELLAAGKPVVAETCYNARPGDTDRYDFLLGHKPPASSPWEPVTTHARAPPTLPH